MTRLGGESGAEPHQILRGGTGGGRGSKNIMYIFFKQNPNPDSFITNACDILSPLLIVTISCNSREIWGRGSNQVSPHLTEGEGGVEKSQKNHIM